jgi:hypothetical protein
MGRARHITAIMGQGKVMGATCTYGKAINIIHGYFSHDYYSRHFVSFL